MIHTDEVELMIHTDEQTTILGAARTTNDSLIVEALAGTGKTTQLIEILKVIRQPSTLVLAFNKRIADEMTRRVPPMPRGRLVHVKTIHAAGLWLLKHFYPKLTVDSNSSEALIRDGANGAPLRVQGAALRLLRLVKDFQHDEQLDLDYAFHLGADFGIFDKLQNGHEMQQAVEVCSHAYASGFRDLDKRDAIDFPDMAWLPLVLDLQPPSRYKAILLDEAQDVAMNQLAMVEKLLAPGGRIIACGDMFQCHPAGTLIELTGGTRIPIEHLRPGMEVVSYHDLFRGLATQGRKILDLSARPYDGEMLLLKAGDESVRVTPNHRLPTKFIGDDGIERWALYLMEYGTTSRLGCCRLFYGGGSGGFGPSMRARHEGADRCWVLDVFDDGDEAVITETMTSIRFGIPEHIFKEKGAYKDRLLAAIGDNSERARSCLASFGRCYDYPLYRKEEGKHISRTYSYVVEACNLLQGLNRLRTFEGTHDGGTWAPIEIERYPFQGSVYSLSVEPTEGGRRLYVADRILVHNCIYEWRGAVGQEVWERLEEKYGAKRYPLTVTWRCDKEIVEAARKLVPGLQARPDAGPGAVHTLDEEEFLDGNFTHFVNEGSIFVLSRTNAELLRIALELWKRSTPFNIAQSTEVLRPLKDILQRILKGPMKDMGVFQQALAAWRATEMIKAQAAGSSTWADRIEDEYKMLFYVSQYTSSPFGIADMLDNIYSYEETCWITLSTVHKAKGLEADHVYLLKQTFQQFQNRRDRDGNPIPIPQEEQNVLYVAITRARKTLVWVNLEQT